MSEYVRTFNRFELKYLIHHEVAQRLMDLMAPHVRADEHAEQGGFYKVVSRYYDSEDLRCYWEKLDGEKYRRKVRVRTYGPTPTEAFLEIKQRYNLNVQKRRIRGSLDDIEETMRQVCAGTYHGDDPMVHEVEFLARTYQLQPKLIVSYNRAAFFDRIKSDLRITLDRNIRSRSVDLDLRRHRTRGVHAVPLDHLILEVKFNENMPRWIATVLNHLDLQIQRISKYCSGIEQIAERTGRA